MESSKVSEVASRYRNQVRQCRLRALVPTQRELARMTGINRSTINALEKQRLFLSSYYALIIAEALECKVDDLFEKLGSKLSGGRGFQSSAGGRR